MQSSPGHTSEEICWAENKDVNRLVLVQIHGGSGTVNVKIESESVQNQFSDFETETVNEKMEPQLDPVSYMGRARVPI